MEKLKAIQIILLSVTVIMTFIGLFLLGVVKRKRHGIQNKKVLIYVVVFLLFYALILLGGQLSRKEPMTIFLMLQAGAIIGGSVHCWWMFRYFKWAKKDGFWPEFWFTVAIVIFSSVGLISIAIWRDMESLAAALSTSMIPFIIPYMVLKSFDAAWNIPSLRYKLWYYPLGSDVPNPTDYDLEDHMKIIAIEFKPTENDDPLNIKVKAPERMELGHYFMTFIEQFNIRNPERMVDLADDSNMPVGWLFYVKAPWYKSARVLDGEITFNDNKVNENDILMAERIYETH